MESPRRQRKNRNGPVPIGCVALFMADVRDTITADPNARDCSSPPERRLSSTLNVSGSTTSTARIACRRALCGLVEPGARMRCREYCAAAASNSLPSWNRPSLEISQESASRGCAEPSAANCTKPSYTLPYSTSDIAAAGLAVGSRTGGSSCVPMIMRCAPCTGHAASITAPSMASAENAARFKVAAEPRSCAAGQQGVGGERHDFRGIHHILDQHVLVRLMGQVENSRTIGNAVAQLADAIDVLLVVGAGRTDKFGLAAQHALNRGRGAARDRPVAIRHGGLHLENIAQLIGKPLAFRRELVQQRAHFAFDAEHILFDEQAAIDHQSAGVRHTGCGKA